MLRVFGKIQVAEDNTESLSPDREFAVRDGTVFVGRYHPISLQEERDRSAKIHASEASVLEIGGQQTVYEAPALENSPQNYVELAVNTSILNLPLARNLDGDNTATEQATTLQSAGLSGTVSRVGPGVEHVSLNDRVMAVWPGGRIDPHVVLPSSLVVRMPESWDFEQAASVPASFVAAI